MEMYRKIEETKNLNPNLVLCKLHNQGLFITMEFLLRQWHEKSVTKLIQLELLFVVFN